MNTSDNTAKVRTVGEWLFDCVNFAVHDSAVRHVVECRNFSIEQDSKEIGVDNLRLMKADLFKWIVLGPGKVNNVTDSDNGWSHSEGGYTLSKDDKKMLASEANAIYEELEPESMFWKKKFRMRSAGIMPAYRDLDGTPLPRKPL